MAMRSIRQEARRTAMEAQAVLRAERSAQEGRIARCAVEVLTAVGERDAAVAEIERRAGEALVRMTTEESLSLRQAMDWLGDQLTLQEAARLRRAARHPSSEPGADDSAGVESDGGKTQKSVVVHDEACAAESPQGSGR